MTKLTFTFIVARSRNMAIGCENQLPWRLPSDLKKFKEITIGKPIIMGRKTFESIGRPLPGRTNIVVSRENGIHVPGILVARSKQQAIDMAREAAVELGTDEVMIIGGAEIFDLFEKEVGRVYLTEVDAVVPNADAFFHREFDEGWRVLDSSKYSHSGDEHSYTLTLLERLVDHSSLRLCGASYAYA